MSNPHRKKRKFNKKVPKLKLNTKPLKALFLKGKNFIGKMKQLNEKYTLKKEAKIGLIAVISVVVIIFVVFMIPPLVQKNKLLKLGYSKPQIVEITKQKLTSTLLKENAYSENLANAIVNKTLDLNYLPLYVVSKECGEREFILYNRLLSMSYSKEQTLTLFKELTFFEITPLLVFDFQQDVQPYIDDVIANRKNNGPDKFVLSKSYREPYSTILPTENPGSVDMLVNKTYYLTDIYTPETLQELSSRYSSKGSYLSSEAASALKSVSAAAEKLELSIYASNAYRSYQRQEEIYANFTKTMGIEKADAKSARPGFSEHQTGLAMDVASNNDSGGGFASTEEYQWMKDNCTTYGWILRYPENKEQITGFDFEPWHYRYVGIELAEKIKQSGLTYDEYYMLYLAKTTTPDTDNKKGQ